MDKSGLKQKKANLISSLRQFDSLLIAFSGGVDSSFLLASAYEVLQDKVLAITAVSEIRSGREKTEASEFAKKLGVNHFFLNSKEMTIPEFCENNADRCYICKKRLFEDLTEIAAVQGISVIAHGANIDDLHDFRPGFKAASEAGIVAPLIDAEMSKKDIRSLSEKAGLDTWNKPAMACLATRIPYGEEITVSGLKMVEKAENFLFRLGFEGCRVRHHNSVARIETRAEDFNRLADGAIKVKIVEAFRQLGFLYVAVDLEGYSTGSMNREIDK